MTALPLRLTRHYQVLITIFIVATKPLLLFSLLPLGFRQLLLITRPLIDQTLIKTVIVDYYLVLANSGVKPSLITI